MFRLLVISAVLSATCASFSVSAQQRPEAPVIAPAAAPVQGGGDRTAAYRINAGDELQIYVWGEERLQRAVKVLPDGTFAFPLVGRVTAEGLLPADIENAITAGLRDQYRGQVPQVTVSVDAPAGMQFSVMGRVKSPGTFNPGRYINVLEALSMAGGPSEFANLDSILLIRKVGDRLVTTQVRLAPLFKSGANNADIERANIMKIQSGDTVIVP